ncbi:DNA primase [Streptomyces coelicoflavus]|uniref:DNA primase n=1 Tax=Streptomyces coelicoflavus TaxID=285562 RepID=UPI00367D949D
MNRTGLGLAIGAGYLLGRTKKLKLAVAVGTMVAGKKMNLTPKGIAELVSGQLQNNPQFKEIGDQLRTDLRGVGKAASGAMVERQMDALADRLRGRTAEVRDQLSEAAPQAAGVGSDDSRDSGDSEDSEYEEPDAHEEPDERRDESEERRAPRRERPARKAPPEARKTARKTPAKTPAKKAAAKAPARKAAAKRAQPAKKAAAKKTSGARQPKGGGER